MTRMEKIDAAFTLQGTGKAFVVIVHARGGDLNTEYAKGLTAILGVLKTLRACLVQANVVSATPATVPIGDRQILDAPIDLETIDPEPFRRQLCRRPAKAGRRPGAKGTGNGTKRICLRLSFPRAHALETLSTTLAKGSRS